MSNAAPLDGVIRRALRAAAMGEDCLSSLRTGLADESAGAISVGIRSPGIRFIIPKPGDPDGAVHIRLDGVLKIITKLIKAAASNDQIPVLAAATYLEIILELKGIPHLLDEDQVHACRILMTYGTRQDVLHKVLRAEDLERFFAEQQGGNSVRLAQALTGLQKLGCIETGNQPGGDRKVILIDQAIIRFPAVEPLQFLGRA